MKLLAFLLIIAIIAYFRYKPNFERANGDLLVYYQLHRYTTDRDYINLSELLRKIFNKY